MAHVGWVTGLLTVILFGYLITHGCRCGPITDREELLLVQLTIGLILTFFQIVYFGVWRNYGWRQVFLQIILVNVLVVPLMVKLTNQVPSPNGILILGILLGLLIGLLLTLVCWLICWMLPRRAHRHRHV